MGAKDTVLSVWKRDSVLKNEDWDEGGGFTTESVESALLKQAEISFNVGIKEVVEFKCDECSTPNFIHLVVPIKKLKEWGIC